MNKKIFIILLSTLLFAHTSLDNFQKEFIEIASNCSKFSVAVETGRVVGSGIIIGTGIVLTNSHIVDRRYDKITIIGYDGSKRNATNMIMDSKSDLAIIFVDTSGLKIATIKNTKDNKLGQLVVTLGNQYGLGKKGKLSFSYGAISGFDREVKPHNNTNNAYYDELIQTTIPLVPGNSGGGLFDIDSNLIGINCLADTNFRKIGFAIPIDTRTRFIINNLWNKKKIKYGFFGITLGNTKLGIKIKSIIPNTAASKCDIKKGDIIIKYRDSMVTNWQDLSKKIGATPIGEKVSIEIIRNNKTKIVEIFTSKGI